MISETPWTRIDREVNTSLEVPNSLWTRTRKFMEAMFHISGATHVAVGTGMMELERPTPCIFLVFNDYAHAFSVKETRELTDIMEMTVANSPDDAWMNIVTDIVLAMRYAADFSAKRFEEKDDAGD